MPSPPQNSTPTPQRPKKRILLEVTPRVVIVGGVGIFCLSFLIEVITEAIRSPLSANDVGRWGLWIAIASILLAATTFIIQQQEQSALTVADQEKKQALRDQAVQIALTQLRLDIKAHTDQYGHSGTYDLLARIIELETKIKYHLGTLDKSKEKSE